MVSANSCTLPNLLVMDSELFFFDDIQKLNSQFRSKIDLLANDDLKDFAVPMSFIQANILIFKEHFTDIHTDIDAYVRHLGIVTKAFISSNEEINTFKSQLNGAPMPKRMLAEDSAGMWLKSSVDGLKEGFVSLDAMNKILEKYEEASKSLDYEGLVLTAQNLSLIHI